MSSAWDAIAVGRALVAYRASILPRARRELRGWRAAAAAIPNPSLRGHALAAVREKGLNAEAITVFATLAPRANRDTALRAMIAFQVAVDYLDTLGEQPAPDLLAGGLQLHGALRDALSAEPPAAAEWYRLSPHREDGGYLRSLVMRCREAVLSLPSHAAVLPVAQRAAGRCGEGQSHTHAAARGGVEGLEAWTAGQGCPPGYLWWEVAAGASSSVAVHALIAAAAAPGTTGEEAALIEAAYFPPIGALTVLLDDLIDREEDLAAGAHSYLTYYASAEVAATRLALLGACARAATARLPKADRHAAILAGVAGFYLSAPGARTASGAATRRALLRSLGFGVRPILLFMRLRRR